VNVVQTDKEKIFQNHRIFYSWCQTNLFQTILWFFPEMDNMLIHYQWVWKILHDHENRTIVAKVTTAVPLQKKQEERIKKVIQQKI